ncbi:MAG TPA: ATP phosphoribosyltransferase [Thermodesulfobium narugense]|uniref:ATP phosphoribosyltransferase n=1 Tax=Thermodesulfobium acidiphilum TaxID=1794699 RepID=A0A2R4VZS3_THEAF|nr:ATP phosphoribosyltransferase [Thermodesulfobium acidiphilum]AWB10039.1 ATP phosphoribosyltransferase catalytic subunit [Thermodesulfobium acidiphilum]PMP86136.1 MAG: ATP phosphoribosyltransferase [Thermodesulfobium narugense]HEM56137.1 ATP phosphoribosyltransferase [Thermodesulfobium narugense]
MLKIAVPKGVLFDPSLKLLKNCGYKIPSDFGRKLLIEDSNQQLSLIIVRPFDMPLYVEEGVVDVAFIGKDVIEETSMSCFEILDLGYGQCRLSVAVPGFSPYRSVEDFHSFIKVGSKYQNLSKKFFIEKGIQVRIFPLGGSVELSPIVGLSDAIIDLVSTGNTLKANNLIEIETILFSTSRLVVNDAKYRLKRKEINEFILRVKEVLDDIY